MSVGAGGHSPPPWGRRKSVCECALFARRVDTYVNNNTILPATYAQLVKPGNEVINDLGMMILRLGL